jgi:hypothetical protein
MTGVQAVSLVAGILARLVDAFFAAMAAGFL